jgi:hypothetical protein
MPPGGRSSGTPPAGSSRSRVDDSTDARTTMTSPSFPACTESLTTDFPAVPGRRRPSPGRRGQPCAQPICRHRRSEHLDGGSWAMTTIAAVQVLGLRVRPPHGREAPAPVGAPSWAHAAAGDVMVLPRRSEDRLAGQREGRSRPSRIALKPPSGTKPHDAVPALNPASSSAYVVVTGVSARDTTKP